MEDKETELVETFLDRPRTAGSLMAATRLEWKTLKVILYHLVMTKRARRSEDGEWSLTERAIADRLRRLTK